MARISVREFLPQLRSVGVRDTGKGVQVSDDVQLVYIADDISRLIAPRPPIEGFATQLVPTNVTRVSGISFRPPADSAAIVTWMRNDGAINSIYIVGSVLDLTNDILPITFDFTTGPGPSRSSATSGTRAAQATGILLPAGENIPDRHPDIVVEPGQILLWVGVSVGSAMTMTWSWREVPL